MVKILGKAKNIYEGWKNYLTDDELVCNIASERAKHCSACPHAEFKQHLLNVKDDIKVIEGYVCSICHCPLSAKLRSPNEKCPDLPSKW